MGGGGTMGRRVAWFGETTDGIYGGVTPAPPRPKNQGMFVED